MLGIETIMQLNPLQRPVKNEIGNLTQIKNNYENNTKYFSKA